MFKKVVSVFLAMFLTLGCFTSLVYAEPVDFIVLNDASISPRYKNFANITAGMSITSDGKAKCTGSYITYSNIKTKIVVLLLESTDGETNWVAVDGESWSASYSTIGNHTSGGTSSCKLNSNYYYCTLTQVFAYDSNGNVTESAMCSSNTYKL